VSRYFHNYLLESTQASSAREVKVIQSLWSGYGKISRYQLKGAQYDSIIVKHIDLNAANSHPRGWTTDLSHQRKVKSYEVETIWYEKWSHLTNSMCKVPEFIEAYRTENEQWILMEDLDKIYPLRKQAVNLEEVQFCLKWLAHFHGRFMNYTPIERWEIGTYWHLDTRPDEWNEIKNMELKKRLN